MQFHKSSKYIIRVILIATPLFLFLIAELLLGMADIDFIRPIRIKCIGDTDWREHHMFTDRDYIPDPWLFWKIDPRNKLTNSKGFLGPEFNLNKPEDTFRIFCLGNSNTRGSGDSSYPQELTYLLQAKPISKRRFEVINGGVSGYSSLQGYRLCSETVKYSPDLITVSFGWNDTCLTRRRPDKYFKPRNKYFLNLERFLYKFRVYQFLKYGYYHLKYNKFDNKASISLQRRVDLDDYKENLVAMAKLAKGNKTGILFITRPFILGAEPCMKGFTENAEMYNSAMRETAETIRVDLIDAEKTFSQHPEYFVDICHFNKEGYKLLAEMIYSYLRTNYTR